MKTKAGEIMSVITVIRRYRCWEGRESPQSPVIFTRQEGFLQICGCSNLREMQIISDQVSALKMHKLCCNCNYCLSFSEDSKVYEQITTEPFMSAATLIFSTLAKFDYNLQSNATVNNADQSTSSMWVWVKRC